MRPVALAVLLASLPAAAQAPDPLDAAHQALARDRRRLMIALVTGGVASTVAGAGLTIPGDDDQAWRVGGALTLGFGVVNVAIGAIALAGAGKASRRWQAERSQRKALSDASRESVAFAVNLGLDAAYLVGGAMAITVSQLGVEHPSRWLAAGIATAVQAVFLLGVDLGGLLIARRAHARFLDVGPLGVSGRF